MILSIETWYEIWTRTYISVAIGIKVDEQMRTVPEDISITIEMIVDDKMKELNTSSP